MPFSILFKNTKYDSFLDEYTPQGIEIHKNSNINDIEIDVSFLKNLYDDNTILNIKPNIRMSLHFMNTTSSGDINTAIANNSRDFSIVEADGLNFITYNESYINKSPSSFSNYKNSINNNTVRVVKESTSNFSIIVDTSNRQLNMNNINYEKFRNLFNYCTSNSISYLKSVVLRISVSFSIEKYNDNIFVVFSKRIPYINLNNKIVNINMLNNITSLSTIE